VLRRLLVAAGVVAAAAVVVAPSPVHAQSAASCTATIAGQSIEGHTNASHPIHVRYDETIRVEGRSSAHVSQVHYKLKVAGRSVDFGENFSTNGSTWSGDASIKKYAWAGVGLYEVVGVATTDAGTCSDQVFICVDGKSPFATAAGGLATTAGVAGITLLARTLSRRQRNTGTLAVGGGLVALGGVVLMQQACIQPLTPMTMAIIPIGAVLGPVIGIAFGRGTPIAYVPPAAPVTPPEQPRSQARNIYQYRASAHACLACRNHAMNKVYASAEAMKRAHPGCKCTIDWRPVDEASYAAYFRAGPEYDPRRTRV
jgi:hypothetical protein